MQITLCDFLGRDNFRFSRYVRRTKLALAPKKLDYEVVGTTFPDKSAPEVGPITGWRRRMAEDYHHAVSTSDGYPH